MASPRMKLVELPHRLSSPPHCCIVSGRTDEPVVDFGDPHTKAHGPRPPRVYLRVTRIKYAAENLLGMVSAERVAELEAELAEAKAEITRLRDSAYQEAVELIEAKLHEPLKPELEDS